MLALESPGLRNETLAHRSDTILASAEAGCLIESLRGAKKTVDIKCAQLD